MDQLKAVIIGAGHAAAQLCVSLRQEGWQGEIVMIGDEPYLPYQRPPLSKTFLAGDKSIDDLLIRPASFYEKKNIQFIRGGVTAIDRRNQCLSLLDGQILRYDKLAICTGASVRKLEVEGCHLKGIHYVRTAGDIEAIQQKLAYLNHVTIIGGGYIGLETAASLRRLNIEVTVLEAAERILQRVASPELSAFYNKLQQDEGVEIFTNTCIKSLRGHEHVEAVICDDNKVIKTDLLIVGIGVIPNISLAEQAGLDIQEGGIWVDENCRTHDINIVAAGDCTSHYSPHYHRKIRLESVPNANEQAKTAAATICGKFKPCKQLPWFWSDQYGVKLQIAGLNQGYDQIVIRGDINHSQSFVIFYLKNKKLIGADCINRPAEFMVSKKLIDEQLVVETRLLEDENNDLKHFL